MKYVRVCKFTCQRLGWIFFLRWICNRTFVFCLCLYWPTNQTKKQVIENKSVPLPMIESTDKSKMTKVNQYSWFQSNASSMFGTCLGPKLPYEVQLFPFYISDVVKVDLTLNATKALVWFFKWQIIAFYCVIVEVR